MPLIPRRTLSKSVRSPTTVSTGNPCSRLQLDARARQRTSSPRATSAFTRCQPTKPVAPVTKTFICKDLFLTQEIPRGHLHELSGIPSGLADHRGLKPRVHRAVLTAAILPRLPVLPVGFAPELLPRMGVLRADEIAGPLPAAGCVGDRAPRRAGEVSEPRRELQEHGG